jgi:hypothetical protein
MTRRRGINSKYTARDFLQPGLRSMFPGSTADAASRPETPADGERQEERDRKATE